MLRVCSNLVRLLGMIVSSNDLLFGDVIDVYLYRVKDLGGFLIVERFTKYLDSYKFITLLFVFIFFCFGE